LLSQEYDDKIYYEIMAPNKPPPNTVIDNGVRITEINNHKKDDTEELDQDDNEKEDDEFIGRVNDEL